MLDFNISVISVVRKRGNAEILCFLEMRVLRLYVVKCFSKKNSWEQRC